MTSTNGLPGSCPVQPSDVLDDFVWLTTRHERKCADAGGRCRAQARHVLESRARALPHRCRRSRRGTAPPRTGAMGSRPLAAALFRREQRALAVPAPSALRRGCCSLADKFSCAAGSMASRLCRGQSERRRASRFPWRQSARASVGRRCPAARRAGRRRSEILELVAMNQLDLIAPLIKNDMEQDAIGRIVAERRNLRDRYAF